MKKRGQISVFIIIALVILFSGILFFFLKGNLNIFKPDNIVPAEIKPLKDFVETCIKDSALQGISLLEMQGGYINPSRELPDTIFDERTYLRLGFKIPLWYFEGKDRMPTKSQMETQLEEYVNSEITACIDNFRQFNEFTIKPESEKKITASINDNDVVVSMEYPLSIQGKDKERKLKDFVMQTPTSLGKMYNLASEIMSYENENGFMERITDEIIATSDELPYEGMDISCKPKEWKVNEIKNYLKQEIALNLPMITFQNTYFIESTMPYYDNLFRMDLTEKDYLDIKADVIYNPAWDMNANVHPSKNGIVRPIEFTPQASGSYDFLASAVLGLCIKIYHHKYSVEYPALIQLTNKNNPDDVFLFAFPVIMKNNLPNRHDEINSFPTQIDIIGSQKFCSNVTSVTEYTINPVTNEVIAYENEEASQEQYPIYVHVKDNYSGEAINNVSISYQCIKFLCKDIGFTQYPTIDGLVTGEEPRLFTRFPRCDGGLFIAEKNSYLSATKQFSVISQNSGQNVIMEMPRKKQVKYQFVVLEKQGEKFAPARQLKTDESVLIILKNSEIDFQNVIFFPGESFQELNLLVGNYNYTVQIRLFENETITGASEFIWKPDVIDVLNRDYVNIFVIKEDNILTMDKESPEWKDLIKKSEKHVPKFI